MDETKLDGLTVQDGVKETTHLFETNVWRLWQTTFSIQPWSSLSHFQRCLKRMLPAFGWIDTLKGAVRTPLNQYDSLIRPLEEYLRREGVSFKQNCQVTDMEFADGPGLTVKTLYLKQRVEEEGARAGEALGFGRRALEPGGTGSMTNGYAAECTS